MKIELQKINLQNFKGIKALEVEFGQDTRIYGENATGKTTIFDGFLWCLFGKDSANKADFQIKPLEATGAEKHNMETSVEVILTIDNKPLGLKKVYQEKYTKKRGTASHEFTGHTTDYFLDDVPLQKKEFDERVKQIIDESVFRLLTDPRYFNEQLHWTDRRKLLMEVCGDVSVQDVIASNSALAGLEAVLNGHGIEDAKKRLAAQRKEINEQLQKIPVRIDEQTRSMVEAPENIDEITSQVRVLEIQKRDIESQIADIRNGEAISKKRIELQDVIAEIQQFRNSFAEDQATLTKPLRDEFDAKTEEYRALDSAIAEIKRGIGKADTDISECEQTLTRLRSEWNEIDAREIPIDETCPTCGQALPTDKVEAARQKARNDKASQLASITQKGKVFAERVEAIKAHRAGLEQEIEKQQKIKHPLRAALDVIGLRIGEIRNMQPDTSELEQKKALIQLDIDNIGKSQQTDIDDLNRRIYKIGEDIAACHAHLRKVENNKAAQKRIEELTAQEKDLAKQFEALEGNLFLIENFIRAKVELLESRINDRFSLVRFKLFADQINGGLTEVCETTLRGVPYPSINSAGRIQAGMDIIKALQAHYNVWAPIWIDNRESVIDLPEMDCQTVGLIVSESDKTLRAECGRIFDASSKLQKAGGM